ncbi:Nse1 non-SMC component of SMC5-6 complex-domain-containing protein [Spinellus fusiger]|nr:Nse1 non-SMC component of SMC5-6 complex-domain-containing protein [Spinellus fusiger]
MNSSSPSSGASAHNDCHRLFLQSMFTQKILAEDKAILLYERVSDLTGVPTVAFEDFIAYINQSINEFDLSLRRSHDERDGHAVIALVNTLDDDIAQISTDYTPGSITYFRQLIEMIVMADDEDYAVSSMTALRLGQKMKPAITQKDTQDLLDCLVRDGWLFCSTSGDYVMETRTVLELQPYLKEQYGEMMNECLICLDVATMGERCGLKDCQVHIHRHCANTYFGEQNKSVCPACATAWSRSNTFGLGLPL